MTLSTPSTRPAPTGTRRKARLSKYVAIARLSFRRRQSERAVLIGRVAFYGLLLMVFSKLWQTVFARAAATGSLPSAAFGDYVWYLVVTEWIMLSQPALHTEVQGDVQSGDIAYELCRPVSYVGSKLSAALGDLALRLVVLGAAGLLFGRFFAESWPSTLALVLAASVGLLASVLMLLCLLAIGLCAFWLHDCMPVYMVWQKLVFVLGGLMLPLSIYPGWLQAIALASPFSAMLFGPGRLVISAEPGVAARLALQLVGWSVLAALVVYLLEHRGRRRLLIEGG